MITDPALVVIDLQNEFCKNWDEQTESWRLNKETVNVEGHDKNLLDNTSNFLQRYRESGRTPIFVKAVHHENTVSDVWANKYNNRDRGVSCYEGSEAAEICSELEPKKGEPIIKKRRYNAFTQTELDLYLSTNDITHVLFAGVNTNVCVGTTVYDAYGRDYEVTVLSDCTGTSADQNLHKSTLKNIKNHFGDVKASSDINLPSVEKDQLVLKK